MEIPKRNFTPIFAVALLVAILFSGCFGGGGGANTWLRVRVVDHDDGSPIPQALVEIVGGSLQTKSTDSLGVALFKRLSGKQEVLIQAAGFVSQTHSVTVNGTAEIEVSLVRDPHAALVQSETELASAMENPEIANIHVNTDILLTDDLIIQRPVSLSLNGKKIVGDVQYVFSDDGDLELPGSGEIDGQLLIQAPNASISNYIKVTGDIVIDELAPCTWNEYYHSNKLVINEAYARINIYNGAQSIITTDEAWDVNINIFEGTVNDFTVNASADITGGEKIIRATVNAYGVVFDRSPQTVTGEESPTITQSFVPGSGGTITAYVPTVAPANTFGALYVNRNHRWPYFGSPGTYPELELRFLPPEGFGGQGYYLQHLDPIDSQWKVYSDTQTSSSDSDNFSIQLFGTGGSSKFRLEMIGGPLDGYVSNEIDVRATAIETYFSNWGMMGTAPYVGELFVGNAAATKISGSIAVSSDYLSYQWYRMDPVTYALEPISGATTVSYEATEDDVGYQLVFRATGDEENIGGYAQVLAPSQGHIVLPNKVFLTEITRDGFILNLHKNVAGISPEDISLTAYGPSGSYSYISVESISSVAGSSAQYRVEAPMPGDTEAFDLQIHAGNWGLCTNYADENHPYIRDYIYHEF